MYCHWYYLHFLNLFNCMFDAVLIPDVGPPRLASLRLVTSAVVGVNQVDRGAHKLFSARLPPQWHGLGHRLNVWSSGIIVL